VSSRLWDAVIRSPAPAAVRWRSRVPAQVGSHLHADPSECQVSGWSGPSPRRTLTDRSRQSPTFVRQIRMAAVSLFAPSARASWTSALIESRHPPEAALKASASAHQSIEQAASAPGMARVSDLLPQPLDSIRSSTGGRLGHATGRPALRSGAKTHRPFVPANLWHGDSNAVLIPGCAPRLVGTLAAL
jgi:hypothetical protein